MRMGLDQVTYWRAKARFLEGNAQVEHFRALARQAEAQRDRELAELARAHGLTFGPQIRFDDETCSVDDLREETANG